MVWHAAGGCHTINGDPNVAKLQKYTIELYKEIEELSEQDFRKFEWGCVGESACADSWGRALQTGEPSLSIPCFAERRYGGVMEDELLMAITPEDLLVAIQGMEALSRNGLRYPIPSYGIQSDARAGLGASYD